MTTIAVIPARGGSKGVPGKNLRLIGGASLLARSVAACAQARGVDRVFVTSDAADILAAAERAGAEPIRRPDDLASDQASSESALLHALAHVEGLGVEVDLLVFVQCTSPFVEARDVDGVIDAVRGENADCGLAVTPFHGFLWGPGDHGVEPVGHEKDVRPRRQDRAPQFLETGAVYAMRAEGFKSARHRFFGRVASYVMEPARAIEIDEPADLVIADAAHRHAVSAALAGALPTPVEAVVFDFDGVMTDDAVYVDETGKETVRALRGDGLGLGHLKASGVPLAVISKEKNPVVRRRCDKLGIECLHGVDDKATAIREWIQARGVRLSQTLFVGNDVNDLPAFAQVGCPVAPADAHPEVLRAAKLVLTRKGGHGAVRELCDLILATQAGGQTQG